MRHEPVPDASLAIAIATRRLINEYDAEIAARRAQLHADRALYRAKLTELEAQENGQADPLGQLYRAHLHAIEALLADFEFKRPA